jgi:hypothetical protein
VYHLKCMREISVNVPQFSDFYKCSSGYRIPGSQFFARLITVLLVNKTMLHINITTLLVNITTLLANKTSLLVILGPWFQIFARNPKKKKIGDHAPEYFCSCQWGPRGGSCIHIPRSEEPHQREGNCNYYLF